MTEAPLSPRPQFPTSLAGGKYTLERRLGQGAMGVVFAGEQVALKRGVAIKLLHPAVTEKPQARERFRREALAASRIEHRNSTRVLDFGEESGICYIVMELLDGRSLGEIVETEGALDVPRAVELVSQILSALALAHDKGIVHRDLKPDNVVIVPAVDDGGLTIERAKVCDFGIAKLVGPDSTGTLTQDGSVAGTPHYMSPEQCQGEDLDARSDLYACGVIFYRLVTGEVPFAGDNVYTIVYRQVTAAHRPPSELRPELPAAIDEFIDRAMAKKRGDRFQSARGMRAALRALAGESPPSPRVVASVASTRQPARMTDPETGPTLDYELPADLTAAPQPELASPRGGGSSIADDAERDADDGQRRGSMPWWQLAAGGAVVVLLAGGWLWWRAADREASNAKPVASASRSVVDTAPAAVATLQAPPRAAAAAPIAHADAASADDTATKARAATPSQVVIADAAAAAEPANGTGRVNSTDGAEAADRATTKTPPEGATTAQPSPSKPAVRKRPRRARRATRRVAAASPASAQAASAAASPGSAQAPQPRLLHRAEPAGGVEAPSVAPAAVAQPKPSGADPSPDAKAPAIAAARPSPAQPKPPVPIISKPVVAPPRPFNPEPAIKLGALHVDGSLTSRAVSNALKPLPGQARGCWRQVGQAAGLTKRTRVQIRCTIDEDGRFRHVKVKGGGRALNSCVAAKVARLRSRVRPDTGIVEVATALDFQP